MVRESNKIHDLKRIHLGSTIKRMDNLRRMLVLFAGNKLRKMRRRGDYVDSVPLFDNTIDEIFPGFQRPDEAFEVSMVASRRRFHLPFQVRFTGLLVLPLK